ncbi:hypothetical protein Lal_00030978 [Lupinus albus]|uniref:Auxin-induced protein n=1 Tax=Lupinus albus TaxID=3870 RepID=A0A6A4P3H2_LUPAL|nr:putative transcription factor interactor and regulator AUX-IAA family [Lupinus albus]KAF1863859.1 hypothetical protein Lal_00030978 [Lupinus albus]
MPPPQLGIGDEEGESNVTLLVSSSTTMESVCLNGSKLKEFNYMGLSDSSSVDSSVPSFSSPDENKSNLNLKATELRLGLPGSQSPERDSDLCLRSSTQFDEKPLFPLRPAVDDHHPSSKTAVLGNKRGFSDAMSEFSEVKLIVSSDANTILSSRPSLGVGLKPSSMLENVGAQQEVATTKAAESRPTLNGSANNNNSAPATKAQVVGWPPIRSFRKNSLATTSKNVVEVDRKVGSTTLFVKVSMDGAPYLRKVDLKNYSEYPELSSALEKMFTCFTIGRCGSHGNLNETKLKDQLPGSEYVLSYEDKDGDWMLVGDVPWKMFIDTCRRLRIMKTSDAIGLAAPKVVEKSKGRN